MTKKKNEARIDPRTKEPSESLTLLRKKRENMPQSTISEKKRQGSTEKGAVRRGGLTVGKGKTWLLLGGGGDGMSETDQKKLGGGKRLRTGEGGSPRSEDENYAKD